MGKIDRFRGLIQLETGGQTILLKSLSVDDLFDLLLIFKNKDDQFLNMVKFLKRIIARSLDDEPYGLEGFIVANYLNLMEELTISLGWTTREKLDKLKEEKEEVDPEKEKKKNIALFKARLAAEVNDDEVEDKYITACYILMSKFKYTQEYILSMPATVFLLLIDEMNEQAKREKEEMKRNKTLKK